jgi:hypothetical protein
MKRLIIILLCCVVFNSCDKEGKKEEHLALAGQGENSGLLKLEVNSECVPFYVEHSDYAAGTHYSVIVDSNYWDTSWIAQQDDNIYIRVEDPTPGFGVDNYPNSILKLVEIKIIYKDNIIGSAQKFFSHDNDGVQIYSTTVP